MINTRQKRLVNFIICLSVLSVFATSCDFMSSGYTQELKNQVSALETQNALLLDNQQADFSNAGENGISVPQPPSNDSTEQLITATPSIESLPSGPVQAGIPVIYDGWALTLSKEIDTGTWNGDEYFALSFTLRNMGDQSRVFRYVKSGVVVSDNLGNQYSFSLSDTSCIGTEDQLHLTQQLTIDAGESIQIKSDTWNGCYTKNYFPPIKGILAISVRQLIVSINNWGPYDDVTFILDL